MSANAHRRRPSIRRGSAERYVVANVRWAMRGSTRRSLQKLPFDTRVLPQPLRGGVQAVLEAGGRPNQFIGDGMRWRCSSQRRPREACRQALRAAALISPSAIELNRSSAGAAVVQLRILGIRRRGDRRRRNRPWCFTRARRRHQRLAGYQDAEARRPSRPSSPAVARHRGPPTMPITKRRGHDLFAEADDHCRRAVEGRRASCRAGRRQRAIDRFFFAFSGDLPRGQSAAGGTGSRTSRPKPDTTDWRWATYPQRATDQAAW